MQENYSYHNQDGDKRLEQESELFEVGDGYIIIHEENPSNEVLKSIADALVLEVNINTHFFQLPQFHKKSEGHPFYEGSNGSIISLSQKEMEYLMNNIINNLMQKGLSIVDVMNVPISVKYPNEDLPKELLSSSFLMKPKT